MNALFVLIRQKYFDCVDIDHYTCKLCHNTLSTNGQITKFKKHLATSHKDELNEQEQQFVAVRRNGHFPRVRTSEVWRAFDISPEDGRIAICRICQASIKRSDHGTSSLQRHYWRKHGLEHNVEADEEQAVVISEDSSKIILKPSHKMKLRNPAWEDFGVSKDDETDIYCLVCRQWFRRTRSFNMKRHVQLYHHNKPEQFHLMEHFGKHDDGSFRCRYCDRKYQRVSLYLMSHVLKNHLKMARGQESTPSSLDTVAAVDLTQEPHQN